MCVVEGATTLTYASMTALVAEPTIFELKPKEKRGDNIGHKDSILIGDFRSKRVLHFV